MGLRRAQRQIVWVRDAKYKLTAGGDLFDLSDAPFEEISVAKDSKSLAAMTARGRLREVLDQHPAAPGHSGGMKALVKRFRTATGME